MKRMSQGFKLIGGLTCLVAVAAACNSGLLGGAFLGGSGSTVAQILPEAISLEIQELGNEENNAAKSKNNERCTGNPALDRTLRAGALVLHAFHRLADRGIALGAKIRNDMTDPAQTQVSGNLFPPGMTVPYKADFGAFDFDGDGTADGSGLANVEPVAVRIWVDKGSGYERFMCALVATRPTNANLGAGQMYFKPIAPHRDMPPPQGGNASMGGAGGAPPEDVQIFVKWDRTDATHKWNEAYISGHLRPDVHIGSGHQRVDVRSADGTTIEKTVRSSDTFTDHPLGFENYQFSSHFRRGESNVLLSGLSTGGTMQVGFTNVCVNVATCVLDTQGACSTFDTQDMAFIEAPAGGETDFPAGFPDTPTF